MKIKVLTIVTFLMFIAGCSSTPTKENINTEYVDYNRDHVINELRKSSNAVSEALMIMARNDNALKSQELTPSQIRQQNASISAVPPGMEREMQFNWSGNAVQALRAMAEASDYTFILGGKKPVPMLEPIVYIDNRDSIINLIRLIQSQTREKIEINIHAFDDKRYLEVNYAR